MRIHIYLAMLLLLGCSSGSGTSDVVQSVNEGKDDTTPGVGARPSDPSDDDPADGSPKPTAPSAGGTTTVTIVQPDPTPADPQDPPATDPPASTPPATDPPATFDAGSGLNAATCETIDAALAEFVADNRACETTEDCMVTYADCAPVRVSCEGSVYLNTSADATTWTKLIDTWRACNADTDCALCDLLTPPPTCAKGVCSSALR